MALAPTPADVLPSGEISPRAHTTRIQHGLLAPMRDGTLLALDLIRPDAPGPLPVILTRTPYDKSLARGNAQLQALAERGYIIAVQDTRGRFNSDGEFFPYKDDRADGYDTVEWLAAQEWCDGNIGMAGGSYGGQTQWLAAADAPPHLKCIVPVCSPPDAFANEPILNGCFLLPMGEWMLTMGRRSWQLPNPAWFDQPHDYYAALPLASLAERAGVSSPWWDEMMQHPNLDALWRACSYQDAWARIDVPALNISGWWDMNFPGAWTNFAGMQERGHTQQIRAGQQLIIGPWPHWVNQTRTLNGVDFGGQAVVNLEQYVTRFYDRWLKGAPNGLDRDPRAHVFVLGANEWWTSDAWPLPEAEPTPYYFHSNGHANSLKGAGGLSPEPPAAEPSDTYAYDPADPIGMFWDVRDGPVDDRLPSIRDDMLCYTSEALAQPLDVVGPVTVVLYAASSARDTDWHVRLIDVHPDGAARFLCHGALRARFRDSFTEPRLLEPGAVYRYEFGVDACGVRFLPGHRIRVEVMSSWWPEYDRNTNSGAPNNFLDANIVVAQQRVFHEPGRASHIVLPVVRGRGGVS